MLATRWEPLVQLNRFRTEMDRLFEPWGDRRESPNARSTFPPLNLWESDDSLFVEAELPGFELDDLEITVTGGNQLHLQGERKAPTVEGGKWHRRERGFGKFNRTIELAGDVDCDKVSAEFKNGVLLVTLPKREEVKPRRIEVKVN